MENLFIDRKGTELDVEGLRLLLRVPNEPRPVSLPLRNLRFVALFASVDLSSRVLLALGQADVTLVIVHPRKADDSLVVHAFNHGAVSRRLAQFQLSAQPDRVLAMARLLVRAKLLSYYRVALRCRRQRPDKRRVLTSTLRQLKAAFYAVESASSLDSVRGYEGTAASAWFSAYAELVPPHWQFTGRKRRPPPDPVNAVLSLTYTLVLGEVTRALASAGLDAGVGVLHELAYGRPSLACDLLELLRAEVDAWVMGLMKYQFKPSHFSNPMPGECQMSKEGRALFFPLYQCRARDWQSRCHTLARACVKQLDGMAVQPITEGETHV